LAELAFVAWHWVISYQITPTLKISQFAIIVGALGLLAERVYATWHDDHKIDWNEVGIPAVFVAVVIFVLLFAFSGLWDATAF